MKSKDEIVTFARIKVHELWRVNRDKRTIDLLGVNPLYLQIPYLKKLQKKNPKIWYVLKAVLVEVIKSEEGLTIASIE